MNETGHHKAQGAISRRVYGLLAKLLAKYPPFDPASLNDPVAMQTAWTPLRGGGANFQTSRLVEVHPGRMEFRATAGLFLFTLFFMAMGTGAMILPLAFALKQGLLRAGLMAIIPMLIGTVFVLVGGAMLRGAGVPVVIDKEEKAVWRGRKSPREIFDKAELEDFTAMDRIHAVQLIREHCRGNDNSYSSFEMNLVLTDGGRVNLADHGNRRRLCEDAQKLADFLGVPVWDAI